MASGVVCRLAWCAVTGVWEIFRGGVGGCPGRGGWGAGRGDGGLAVAEAGDAAGEAGSRFARAWLADEHGVRDLLNPHLPAHFRIAVFFWPRRTLTGPRCWLRAVSLQPSRRNVRERLLSVFPPANRPGSRTTPAPWPWLSSPFPWPAAPRLHDSSLRGREGRWSPEGCLSRRNPCQHICQVQFC